MAKQLLWAVSMYKAKAEIVNGLRVFADGKWLTCVGNKNVQVGDLIWTDGRCVYGFNKISQQSLVITTSSVTKWFIPILSNYEAYVYTKDGLIKIGDMPKEYGNTIIVSDGKIYSSNIRYTSHENAVLAVNVKNNDIYALYCANFSWHYPEGSSFTIQLLKNNEIISQFAGISSNIVKSFVDDDNNWFIAYKQTDAEDYESNSVAGGPPDPKYGFEHTIFTENIKEHYANALYLLRNSVKSAIFSQALGSEIEKHIYLIGRTPDMPHTIITQTVTTINKVSISHDNKMLNLIIPLNNGFYYIINSTYYEYFGKMSETPPSDFVKYQTPVFVNASIF